MKTFSKIFVIAASLSLALASSAYAEETQTTEPATAPVAVVSEPASTATVIPPTPPEVVTEVPAVPPPVEKTTLENLQTAFNGESNAHARYLAFAKKAEAEGYGKVASLFRAAARAERVHFERHAKVIKKMKAVPTAKIDSPDVKSTAENLQAAFDGETYESTKMYPEFLAKAEKDQIKDAVDAFEDAGAAEAVHASLYKKAMENLPEWKGKNKKFYVCTFCGNVVEKIDFKVCPLCGKGKELYVFVR